MVSVNGNIPSLSGLNTGNFDNISVGSINVNNDLTVSGNINQNTQNTTATLQIVRCRNFQVTEPSGGQFTVNGNQCRFDGSDTPSFSTKGVYLAMNGGQNASVHLCSDTTSNRFINFATANGTSLATIQSWTNNAGDLRFTTNGMTERLRIYASGLSEFYGNVNLSANNSLQMGGVSVLTNNGGTTNLNVTTLDSRYISIESDTALVSPPVWVLGTDTTNTKNGWTVSASSFNFDSPSDPFVADNFSSSLWSAGSNNYNNIGSGSIWRNYTGSVSTTLLNSQIRNGEWWQIETNGMYSIDSWSLNYSGALPESAIELNARLVYEAYLLGSETGLNGTWIEVGTYIGDPSTTSYQFSFVLTTDNAIRFIPSRFFRIVCNKVKNRAGSPNVFHNFHIAQQTIVLNPVPLSVSGRTVNFNSELRMGGVQLSNQNRDLNVASITSSGVITGLIGTASQTNITRVGNQLGVGVVPDAVLHVETNRTVNNPANQGLLVRNVNAISSSHAYCTLRTQATGGNPVLSFDVEGVAGWSMFCDNADNEDLKITNSWQTGVGSSFLHLRRNNNTINIGQTVFFVPRSIISNCKRNSSGSWLGGVQLIGQYLQNDIVINYTPNPASNGIRPNGYVAPISGMYIMTFTARFQDNGGLVSCMPRVNGNNVFVSDYWIPNDGSGRRSCTLTHTVQLNSGDAYEIVSTNGNTILYGEFTAQLATSYGI